MTDIHERLAPVLEIADHNATDVDAAARFPSETVEALASSGLLGLGVPESYGGIGGGPSEVATAITELAVRCGSSAMVYLMHVCATQTILAAPPKGGEDVLRDVTAGRHLTTLAFSERGSRSHFWAPVSVLNDGRLQADKSFVTSAGHAHSFVTTVGTGDDSNAPSLYLIPAKNPGLAVSAAWDGFGLRGNASAPMTFDVPVNDDMLIGKAGGGMEIMLNTVVPWFQIGSAAVSLGLARAATAATATHVSSARLEHAGHTLADLPTVRARVGRMQVAVDALTGFVEGAAARLDRGDGSLVLAAKAFANETAVRVVDEAMQACGGAAYSKRLPLERIFRDARAGSVMAPTTDVLHELVGRAALGMPLMD